MGAWTVAISGSGDEQAAEVAVKAVVDSLRGSNQTITTADFTVYVPQVTAL